MPISLIPQPDAGSIEFARRHAAATISPPGVRPGSGFAGGDFAGGGFAAYLASVMRAGGASHAAGDISRPDESARAAEPGETGQRRATNPTKEEKRVSDDLVKEPKSTDTVRDGERADEASRERARSERAAAERAAADRDDAAAAAGKESEAASAALAERSRNAQREASEKRVAGNGSSVEDADPSHEAKAAAASAGAAGAMKALTDSRVSESRRDGGEDTVAPPRVTTRNGRTSVEIDVRVKAGQAESRASAGAANDGAKADAGGGSAANAAAQTAADEVAKAERESAARPEGRGAPANGSADEATKFDLRAEAAGRERETARRGDAAREGSGERGERRVEVRDLRARGNDARGGSDANRDNDAGASAARAKLTQKADANGEDTGYGHSSREGASSFEALRADSDATTGRAGRGSGPASRMTAQAADLRRALNEQLNGDIVRSARLVVRGSDRGEIRLNLKPESLGSVRIALQMQDGHIAGRIIVDNQSVRDVFEQNLAALQKAFAESGMDASGLEVTVADSGSDSGETDDGTSGKRSAGNAAATFENAVPTVSSIEERHDLVDLVV